MTSCVPSSREIKLYSVRISRMDATGKRKRVLLYGGAAVALAAALGLGWWFRTSRNQASVADGHKQTTQPATAKTPENEGSTTFASLEAAGYVFNAEQSLVFRKDGMICS